MLLLFVGLGDGEHVFAIDAHAADAASPLSRKFKLSILPSLYPSQAHFILIAIGRQRGPNQSRRQPSERVSIRFFLISIHLLLCLDAFARLLAISRLKLSQASR